MDSARKNIIENYERMNIGIDEPFKFHCTMCGKCCINREDILLSPIDVYNMAKELSITTKEFFETYCEAYIGSDSQMPIMRLKPRGSIKRCPLLKDRKCSVHKAKPVVCAMFPIGRCVPAESYDKKTKSITKVDYIFTDPGCGDDSENHTIREWFNEFGIPLDDVFFRKWMSFFIRLATKFRDAEPNTAPGVMQKAWDITLVKMYLDYDLNKDFMPQFEENADFIINLMKLMPVRKGGKK